MVSSQINLLTEKCRMTSKVDRVIKIDSYEEQVAVEKQALDTLIESIKLASVSSTHRNSTNESTHKIRRQSNMNDEFEQLFDPSMNFLHEFVCHYWDSSDHDRKGE